MRNSTIRPEASPRTALSSINSSPRSTATELILDFDATDDLVHGNQRGRHFSAYYNDYCFLPLYVFCGERLLAAYLRPASKDPADIVIKWSDCSI